MKDKTQQFMFFKRNFTFKVESFSKVESFLGAATTTNIDYSKNISSKNRNQQLSSLKLKDYNDELKNPSHKRN